MVRSASSQQEGPWFNAQVRGFLCGVCIFFLCLCGFSVGNPASSHSPNTFKLWVGRLMGHSKLSAGVNVSVDGCLFLYVSPAMNLSMVSLPLPEDAVIGPREDIRFRLYSSFSFAQMSSIHPFSFTT